MTAGKGACPGSENIIGHLAAAIETYTHQNTRDEKAQKEFYEQLTTIREEDIRPLYIDLSVKGPRDENALFAAADLINHLNNLQHQVLAGQIALMDKYDSGVVDRIGRGDLRSDGLAKDLLEEWRARYGSKAVPAEVMLLLARAAENATRPHSRQRQDAGAAADTLAAIFGSLFVHEQNNFLGYLYYQSIREDRGAYAFAAHYLEPRSGTDGMNFVIYPPIESVGAPGTDTAEGARLAGRKGSSYPGDKAFEALLWRFQAHLTNIGRQLKITHQEVLYLIKKHRFKTLARRIRRQREDDYPGDSKFAAVLRRHKAHQKAVAAQLGVTDSKVSAWIVTHRFKTLATLLRKERNSRYPGHAKFRALLHKHGGNLSRIAEALNVKQGTISHWVVMHRFATYLRKLKGRDNPVGRPSGYPGNEKFKALLEKHRAGLGLIAKRLKVSAGTVHIWISRHHFKGLAGSLREGERPDHKGRGARLARRSDRAEAEQSILERHAVIVRRVQRIEDRRVEDPQYANETDLVMDALPVALDEVYTTASGRRHLIPRDVLKSNAARAHSAHFMRALWQDPLLSTAINDGTLTPKEFSVIKRYFSLSRKDLSANEKRFIAAVAAMAEDPNWDSVIHKAVGILLWDTKRIPTASEVRSYLRLWEEYDRAKERGKMSETTFHKAVNLISFQLKSISGIRHARYFGPSKKAVWYTLGRYQMKKKVLEDIRTLSEVRPAIGDPWMGRPDSEGARLAERLIMSSEDLKKARSGHIYPRGGKLLHQSHWSRVLELPGASTELVIKQPQSPVALEERIARWIFDHEVRAAQAIRSLGIERADGFYGPSNLLAGFEYYPEDRHRRGVIMPRLAGENARARFHSGPEYQSAASPAHNKRFESVLHYLETAAAMAEAVALFNSLGWVHGDLKPANFFVEGPRKGREQKIILYDFDTARTVGESTPYYEDGKKLIMGTDGFMSSEQAAGFPASFKDDVYGLSATLAWLWSGHLLYTPYEGTNMEGRRIQQKNADNFGIWPDFEKALDGNPLKEVILTGLAKPGMRPYARVSEMMNEIQAAIDREAGARLAKKGGEAGRPRSAQPSRTDRGAEEKELTRFMRALFSKGDGFRVARNDTFAWLRRYEVTTGERSYLVRYTVSVVKGAEAASTHMSIDYDEPETGDKKYLLLRKDDPRFSKVVERLKELAPVSDGGPDDWAASGARLAASADKSAPGGLAAELEEYERLMAAMEVQALTRVQETRPEDLLGYDRLLRELTDIYLRNRPELKERLDKLRVPVDSLLAVTERSGGEEFLMALASDLNQNSRTSPNDRIRAMLFMGFKATQIVMDYLGHRKSTGYERRLEYEKARQVTVAALALNPQDEKLRFDYAMHLRHLSPDDPEKLAEAEKILMGLDETRDTRVAMGYVKLELARDVYNEAREELGRGKTAQAYVLQQKAERLIAEGIRSLDLEARPFLRGISGPRGKMSMALTGLVFLNMLATDVSRLSERMPEDLRPVDYQTRVLQRQMLTLRYASAAIKIDAANPHSWSAYLKALRLARDVTASMGIEKFSPVQLEKFRRVLRQLDNEHGSKEDILSAYPAESDALVASSIENAAREVIMNIQNLLKLIDDRLRQAEQFRRTVVEAIAKYRGESPEEFRAGVDQLMVDSAPDIDKDLAAVMWDFMRPDRIDLVILSAYGATDKKTPEGIQEWAALHDADVSTAEIAKRFQNGRYAYMGYALEKPDTAIPGADTEASGAIVAAGYNASDILYFIENDGSQVAALENEMGRLEPWFEYLGYDRERVGRLRVMGEQLRKLFNDFSERGRQLLGNRKMPKNDRIAMLSSLRLTRVGHDGRGGYKELQHQWKFKLAVFQNEVESLVEQGRTKARSAMSRLSGLKKTYGLSWLDAVIENAQLLMQDFDGLLDASDDSYLSMDVYLALADRAETLEKQAHVLEEDLERIKPLIEQRNRVDRLWKKFKELFADLEASRFMRELETAYSRINEDYENAAFGDDLEGLSKKTADRLANFESELRRLSDFRRREELLIHKVAWLDNRFERVRGAMAGSDTRAEEQRVEALINRVGAMSSILDREPVYGQLDSYETRLVREETELKALLGEAEKGIRLLEERKHAFILRELERVRLFYGHIENWYRQTILPAYQGPVSQKITVSQALDKISGLMDQAFEDLRDDQAVWGLQRWNQFNENTDRLLREVVRLVELGERLQHDEFLEVSRAILHKRTGVYERMTGEEAPEFFKDPAAKADTCAITYQHGGPPKELHVYYTTVPDFFVKTAVFHQVHEKLLGGSAVIQKWRSLAGPASNPLGVKLPLSITLNAWYYYFKMHTRNVNMRVVDFNRQMPILADLAFDIAKVEFEQKRQKLFSSEFPDPLIDPSVNRPWTEEDQVDLMRGLNEMMAIAGADRPGEAVDDTTREFIAKSAREGQITGWRQEVVLFDTDDIEKRWNIDADPKSGARLAEGNAVSALLPLFELEKARTIRMKKGDGYSVRTIQVNAKDLSRQWPLKGLTILRHELADTTRFDLVHNAEGRLIAIFPRHARAGKKTFYYDLSDYYVPLDLLKRSPDAETMREWELFAEQVKKDKAAIRRYQAARRDRGLMPGTMMPDRQKPFFFAQIDPRSGEYDVVPFSHEDLTLSGSGSVLLEKFKMRPGTRRGIFVNFPSVYPPAHGANINSDREFVRTVLKGALTRPLVGGDNVLDVGTGTGFLLWVVHSAALERGVKLDYFATDINPIAVANATLNTAVAGIPLRAAKVYDNLISPKGVPVFPEERFKMILSNSPAYLPGTGMADEWEEIATVGQKAQNLKSFWDGDLSGEFTLRFAEGLFKQLHPEGVAIAWNQIVTELGLDPVAEIFKHARSDDSKWGLHVSAKRLWMAENLYFSTYVITLAKSGARFAAVGDWPGRSGEESDLDFHGRVERMIARGLTYEEAMLWWKSKVYSDITFPKGFWASPTTAIHFTLVVLDELVPGFRAARQRNDIRTMAGLYRQYVKSYEPKDRKRYATKGAQSFFYEMGRLGGLMNGQRTYLSKTGSPGALIRLALPELIDLTNPDALDPLEVESGYWNDPENAKYHILKTLDSIPGFRQARERNDIAAMAKLYRDHVIGYVSKDKTKYPRNGQLSFFFEVGGLMSLLNNRQTYLQRKGSPYAILSLALPRLVDQSDPGALRLSELGYTAEDQMMLAPVLRTYGKKETIQNAPVFDFSAMNIFFDWYEAQDTKALQDAQIPARKISAGHTAKLLSAAGKVRGSGRYFVMKAVAYDRAMRQKDVISKEIQRIWSSKPFKNYPTPEARLRAEFNNDLLLSGTFKPVRKSFRDYVLNIAFERYGRQLVPGARLAKSPGQADALDGGAWLLVASTFLKSDTAVKHRYDHVLEKYPVSHVTAALFVLASASSRRAGFQDIYSRYIHYTGLGHSVEISALLTAASVFTKDKSLGVPLHYYEELVEKVRHKFVSAILTLATAFETQQSWGVVEGLYREMLEQDTVGDPVAAAALSIAAARRGTSVEKLKTLFEVYGRGRRSSYVSALLTLAHSLSSPKSVEDLKKKHESFMDFIQFGPIGARLAETERALTQKRRDGVVRRLYEKSLRGKKVTISELVADLGMKFHTVYDDLNARGLLNSKRLDIDRRKPLSMRELNMRRDQVSKTLLHKNPAHGKKWTIPMLAKALELPREIVYRDLRAGKLLGSKRLHLREMPTEEGLEARRARVANKLKEWNIIRLADELGLDPDTVYTDLKSMNLLSRLGMRTVRRTPAAEVKSRRQRVKKRFYERPPDGRQWTVTALADDLELPLKTVFDDLKKLDLLDSKRLRRHHGKQGARLAATRVSSPSPAVGEPAGSRLAVNEEWDEDAPRMEKLRRMRPGQKRKNSDAESRFIEEKRKLKARLEEARQLTKAGRFDEAEEVLRSLIKHGENLTAQAAESWRLQFLIELNYIHTAQAVNFSKQATRAFRDWNATRDPEALKHAQTLNQQTLASFENARKNLLSVMASLQEKRETNQFWSDRLTWLEGEIRFTEARIARTSSASQSGARPDTEASSGLASDGARLADGVAGSSDVELLRNRVNVHMKAEPIRKAVERLILEIVDTFSKADRSKHLALALGPYNEDPITFKIRVNDTETRLDLMIPGLDDPILMIEGDLRQKLEFLKKEEGSYIHPEGVPPPVHTLLNISKIRVDIALNSVPSGRHPVGHVIPVAAFGEDPKDAQLTLLITQLAGTHRIEARRQDRFYLEGLSAAQIRSAEKLIDKHKAHKYIFLLAPEEDKDFKGIVVRYVPTDSLKTAPVRDERTLLFPVAGFEADALLGWFEAIPTAGALADAYGAAFDPRTLQIDHTKVDPSSFHMNVYSLFLEKTLNKGLDRAALKAVLEGRADLDTFRQASFFLPLARKVPLQELIRGARLAMQALGAAA
jgi:serine/threonine protein kinase